MKRYPSEVPGLESSRSGAVAYSRIFVSVCTVSYAAIFFYIYVVWASVNYYYIGFYYVRNDFGTGLAFVIIALFSVIIPYRVNKYSDFFCCMIFLMAFIPSIIILPIQGYQTFDYILLMVSISISFFLVMYIPNWIRLRSYRFTKLSSIDAFFFIFCVFYFLSMVFYIATYRGMMSFSGLDDIYEQRARFGEMDASTLARYLTGWLSNAMSPYLIAVGLFDRTRRWAIAVGVAGQIIVFMAFAGKIMLAMLVVMFGFYFFALRRGRISVSVIVLGFLVLVGSIWGVLEATSYQPTAFTLDAVALIYMRTLGIQGAMVGVYADVFSRGEMTYWSHVNIINLIIPYPYRVPLGYVVGAQLVGGNGFNANANFWATDGVAAYGYVGVVVIGAILGILLTLANKVVTHERLPFAATVSIPFIMSLGNASLFTSLITGGGLMMVLMIAYGMPRPKARVAQGPARGSSRLIGRRNTLPS